MKKFYIWKMIGKIRQIRMCGQNAWPSLLSRWTWNIPLRILIPITVRSRENIPGYFPALSKITRDAVDHPCMSYRPVMHFDCNCVLQLFILFPPPPSLPIDPATADDAAGYDYVPDDHPTDDQPLAAELPGKQTPLDHSYIAQSFSLMLALELLLLLFR